MDEENDGNEATNSFDVDKWLNVGLEFFKASQNKQGNTTAQAATATEPRYGGFTMTQILLGGGAILAVILLISLFRK